MSKSLGNVIDPFEYVEKYGTDALRYYLLAKISPTEDSDFTKEKFEEAYNGDLANGLGNLVSRVAKLCETSGFDFDPTSTDINEIRRRIPNHRIIKAIENYRFDKALNYIWRSDVKWGLRWLKEEVNGIKWTDQSLSEDQPWNLKGEELKMSLTLYVINIRWIAALLKPFLPETAEKIEKQFKGPAIKSEEPLFPRLK